MRVTKSFATSTASAFTPRDVVGDWLLSLGLLADESQANSPCGYEDAAVSCPPSAAVPATLDRDPAATRRAVHEIPPKWRNTSATSTPAAGCHETQCESRGTPHNRSEGALARLLHSYLPSWSRTYRAHFG